MTIRGCKKRLRIRLSDSSHLKRNCLAKKFRARAFKFFKNTLIRALFVFAQLTTITVYLPLKCNFIVPELSGAETCVWKEYQELERVQAEFLKWNFGAARKRPGYRAREETKRAKLSVDAEMRAVKYEEKISDRTECKFLNDCFIVSDKSSFLALEISLFLAHFLQFLPKLYNQNLAICSNHPLVYLKRKEASKKDSDKYYERNSYESSEVEGLRERELRMAGGLHRYLDRESKTEKKG
mgnify:FL=1